jgi:hypothetical protein
MSDTKKRYSGLNRQQRRALQKQKPEEPVHPDPTLSEYMKHPGLVVKRSELFGVVDKIIRLHEMKRKRDRPWRKLARWLDV